MTPVKRGAAAAAMLAVAGVGGAFLASVAAAEEVEPRAAIEGQDDYYPAPPTETPSPYPTPSLPTGSPTPSPSTPVETPTPTPYETPPPETTAPPETPPASAAPPGPPMQPGGELPVTGVRSLTVAGVGLMLVGIGILSWVLAGRRRVRA